MTRSRRALVRSAALVVALGASGLVVVPVAAAHPSGQATVRPADSGTYSAIGQPSLAGSSLGSRCSGANASFSSHDFGGNFATHGPTGIAIGPAGRLFVADDGGHRVLSWPNADAVSSCQSADKVIGGGNGVMSGPEAITVDGTGAVYVADTLNHTVDIFVPSSSGSYPANPTYTLGTPGTAGTATNQLDYPRGLAVDENGRLYVADDDNNRVLIFDPPFSSGMSADDSIGASNDGGFSAPKAVAVSGDSLFVADYDNNRVLRFTGPFDDPATTYTSTATFGGLTHPVDLALGPDGSLYTSTQGDDLAISPGVAVDTDAIAGAGKGQPDATSTFGGYITGAPLGVAVDSSSRIFLSDYDGFRVLVHYLPASTGPVDHSASAATVKLLSLLRSRAGVSTKRVLLGQELNSFSHSKSTWYRDFSRLHKRKLRTPMVMAAEVDSLRNGANDPVLNELIAHSQAGGVVEMDWHPNDPVDDSYPGTAVTADQMRQMSSDPGSALYKSWHAELDTAAATLQRLAAAGVPVLFRPLVEMNGLQYFFWWSDDGTSGAAHAAHIQAFDALWREMGQYLTVDKGLHNLLFLYSPNGLACYQCAVPAMTEYPGSAYVDAVGADVYDNQLSLGRSPDDSRGRTTYQDMVATGKPFGFSEFGQGANAAGNGTGTQGSHWDLRTLTKRIHDSYPAMAFATAWYSSPAGGGNAAYVYGLSDVADVPAVLKDPLVKTLPKSAP